MKSSISVPCTMANYCFMAEALLCFLQSAASLLSRYHHLRRPSLRHFWYFLFIWVCLEIRYMVKYIICVFWVFGNMCLLNGIEVFLSPSLSSSPSKIFGFRYFTEKTKYHDRSSSPLYKWRVALWKLQNKPYHDVIIHQAALQIHPNWWHIQEWTSTIGCGLLLNSP